MRLKNILLPLLTTISLSIFIGCGNKAEPTEVVKSEAELKSDSLLAATKKRTPNRRIGGKHLHQGNLAEAAHQDPKKKMRMRRNMAKNRDARKKAFRKADSLRYERAKEKGSVDYF
jgi:hypothetical protein